jgi:hypothetical protein
MENVEMWRDEKGSAAPLCITVLVIAGVVYAALHHFGYIRPAAPFWVQAACAHLIATHQYSGSQSACLRGAYLEGDY